VQPGNVDDVGEFRRPEFRSSSSPNRKKKLSCFSFPLYLSDREIHIKRPFFSRIKRVRFPKHHDVIRLYRRLVGVIYHS
jgi:hypothetical protein